MNEHTTTNVTYNDFLTKSDDFIFSAFKQLEDYTVVTNEDNTYLMLMPRSEYITPVLLHSTVEHLDMPWEWNTRIGCAMLYDVANNFTNKPAVLLTKAGKSTQIGAKDFIESNEFRFLKRFVYHLVSTNGTNGRGVFHTGKVHPVVEDLIINKLDSHLLYVTEEENSLLVNNLQIPSVMIGFDENPSTQLQLLIDFIKEINSEHSEVYTVSEHIPEFVYVCEVCNDETKLGSYDKEYEAYLCFNCRNRIIHRKASEVGFELVEKEKGLLKKAKAQSILGNIYTQLIYGKASSVRCPVCAGTLVLYNKKRGCHTCVKCKEKYLNYSHHPEEVVDIYTGDIVEKGNNRFAICQNNYVYVLQLNKDETYSVLSKNFLHVLNDEFFVCSICGEAHPTHWGCERTFLDKQNKYVVLPVCKHCVKKV